jgi:hypothetical protein
MWSLRVVPRRKFLAGLAAWGGAATLLPTLLGRKNPSAPGLCAAPADGSETDLSSSARPLCRDDAETFERHLGTAFRIVPRSGQTSRVVHLSKVTRSQTIAQPGRGAPAATPAFSLIFRGSSAPALVQDTYRVEHSQLGAFPLFIVPVGPGQGSDCYQAIFA